MLQAMILSNDLSTFASARSVTQNYYMISTAPRVNSTEFNKNPTLNTIFYSTEINGMIQKDKKSLPKSKPHPASLPRIYSCHFKKTWHRHRGWMVGILIARLSSKRSQFSSSTKGIKESHPTPSPMARNKHVTPIWPITEPHLPRHKPGQSGPPLGFPDLELRQKQPCLWALGARRT